MKAAFAIVVLLALSQTALGRPSTQLARSRGGYCLDILKLRVSAHVEELGEWGKSFVASIVAVQAALEYGRELCDKILVNDPPSFIEQYLFDICVTENDNLADLESERIRRVLQEKVNEQPELLKGYLYEFTLCLLGLN